MLFCEFCEISKNTFFTEHLRVTASENNSKKSGFDTNFLMFQSTCKWYEWLEFLENGEIFLNSNVETITLDESETDWQITEEKDGFLRQKYGNFKLKIYRT